MQSCWLAVGKKKRERVNDTKWRLAFLALKKKRNVSAATYQKVGEVLSFSLRCCNCRFLRSTGVGDGTTIALFRMSVILQKLSFTGGRGGSLQDAHLQEKDGATFTLVFAERQAIFGSFVVSASTQRCVIHTQCFGGVTGVGGSFVLLLLYYFMFVPFSHTHVAVSCFFFFFFDSLISTGVCCILYVFYTSALLLEDTPAVRFEVI